MTEQVYNLTIAPGIQKDGTQFDSGTYVDGRWCRFQRGRPRKMGGYNGIFLNAPGITRGMIQQSRNGENYVYGGYSDSLQYWQTNNAFGIGSGPYNINFIGVITALEATDRGSGYTDGTYTNVALTGGSGTGATANFVVLNGRVNIDVVVNFGGLNYSTIDTLTATLPGGSGLALKVSTVDSFIPNANNLWQFDISYDATGGNALTLLAHPGQNLTDVDSSVATPVLQGSFPGGDMSKVGRFQVTGTASGNTITIASENFLIGVGQTVITNIAGAIPSGTTVTAVTVVAAPSPLTTVTLSNAVTGSPTVFQFDNKVEVSGGLVMLYPYLFVYGSNGLLRNSSAGDFSNWVAADANATNVASTKVVKGLPVRGGTTAPAGLFWSLDSLIRVVYNPTTIGGSAGATIYWTYDIITSQNSIMSSQCVIEYDGLYYWAGTDRFLMYNGVVQEIPNVMNMNFFFDNVNYVERQKTWISKVPRWGEVWWFYCADGSSECVNAIVYNVREKVWYDAGFADGAKRSSGVFTEVFHYPIWASTEANKLGGYTLWQHEFGTDEIVLSTVNAIDSYFETNSLGWVSGGPGQRSIQGLNRWIRLERVEPNFIQSGEMTLIVTGKSYADDVAELSDPYVFTPSTPKIDMREQRREMRLKFESNVAGGNYELGNIVLSADIGDVRGTGNP